MKVNYSIRAIHIAVAYRRAAWTPLNSWAGAQARRAAKKRNELPPELRGRATIVRDVNRIFRRAACSLARFVELGGGLS